MECKQSINVKMCNCSYSPCSKKAKCCDCIKSHISNRELPACCFPNDVERTYNRSFEKFAELVNSRKV